MQFVLKELDFAVFCTMIFGEYQNNKELREIRLEGLIFVLLQILILFLAFAQNVPDFVRIIVHTFNS